MIRHDRSRLGRALGVLALAGMIGMGAGGCDFLDPTNVENPRTTDEDLAQALEPTAALLPGLRAQFARLVESTVVLTENISDDYSIHGTGLDDTYDYPNRIRPVEVNSTGRVTGLYWNAQELRALADFVIDEIIPGDENATADMTAEAHYYRGMAFLHLAENMVGAPIEVDGAAQGPDVLYGLAETDLLAATSHSAEVGTAAKAALARAYRGMGQGTDAANYASQVLADDPTFAFLAQYDQSSIDNVAHWYLVSRTLREMQPLPRLDFLDPKYLTFDAGIPVAKAEEMHLILAEVAMAGGTWATGGGHLATAIEVAQARGTTPFNDNDPRINSDFTVRPRDQEIVIRADDTAEYRAGLVFERPGLIDVPTISGTSLDADSIRTIPGANQDELLHALYLARQEILFLEGRRMSDLGIRIPVMLREIENNAGIAEGDFATEVFVPTYIPSEKQMDLYTPAEPYPAGTAADDVDVEPATTQVTIMHDMNAILVANRTSLPLF